MLKQSESVAREAEIRAPADGVILHRMAEPGLLLGAGQPAVTMAFADRLYVRTFIPETKLGRVRMGSPAEVSVDSFPGRTFSAKVTEISPDAEFTPKPVDTPRERVNLVYAAKVDLDAGWNAPLVPGQPADVRVKVAESAREVIRAERLVRSFGSATGAARDRPRDRARRDVRAHRARRRRQDDVLPDRRGPSRADLRARVRREDVPFGMVPQRFSLYEDLTVDENLALRARLYSVPPAEGAARASDLLGRVGLDRFGARLAGALSGGMKQKLSLVAALLTRPALLLLDEPTTGVDPVSRREFWQVLNALHHEGLTIVVSTPYMDEAEYATAPRLPRRRAARRVRDARRDPRGLPAPSRRDRDGRPRRDAHAPRRDARSGRHLPLRDAACT